MSYRLIHLVKHKKWRLRAVTQYKLLNYYKRRGAARVITREEVAAIRNVASTKQPLWESPF